MIKRILVPTDFSEPSLAAIRYGLDLAETVRGEMILLHVVEEKPVCNYVVGERPVFLRDEFAPDLDPLRRSLPQRIIRRDLCEEAYWKLAVLFPPAYRNRVRMAVTVGKPAREIIRVAREQNADLIMLGDGGRGGLRRLLRRTVTDKLMRKAPIPVIALNAHRGPDGHHAAAPTRRPWRYTGDVRPGLGDEYRPRQANASVRVSSNDATCCGGATGPARDSGPDRGASPLRVLRS